MVWDSSKLICCFFRVYYLWSSLSVMKLIIGTLLLKMLCKHSFTLQIGSIILCESRFFVCFKIWLWYYSLVYSEKKNFLWYQILQNKYCFILKQWALSLDIGPIPTIGTVKWVLLCVDNGIYPVNIQCFQLGLTLVRPILRIEPKIVTKMWLRGSMLAVYR